MSPVTQQKQRIHLFIVASVPHCSGYKASTPALLLLPYATLLRDLLPLPTISPFPTNNSYNMPSLKNLILLVAAAATGVTQALPTVELVDRQQHLIGWLAMCPGPLWGATCQVPSWTSKQCCQ
jgi:hypothetical protein